eukprot:6905646-Pyramimonas_sp.AAC.1
MPRGNFLPLPSRCSPPAAGPLAPPASRGLVSFAWIMASALFAELLVLVAVPSALLAVLVVLATFSASSSL